MVHRKLENCSPLLNAKETAVKPSVTSKSDPKYRKLIQIWDQLLFFGIESYGDTLRILRVQGVFTNWWFLIH